MRDLEELRSEIDRIDRELVRLFEERMETVLEVAEYKKENGLPVLNAGRESVVIEKCISCLKDHELDLYLTRWVEYTMALSKERQEKYLRENA